MNYLIHATPVHPSLCLQYLILLFIIATISVFTLLLLLLFYYCHHYKTVATDKPLWASLFPGAAELTSHLLRLINIIWLPLCWINKFGFYFPRRLLRSPILVGHQLFSRTNTLNYFIFPEIQILPSRKHVLWLLMKYMIISIFPLKGFATWKTKKFQQEQRKPRSNLRYAYKDIYIEIHIPS
jgi:hypothetical protein